MQCGWKEKGDIDISERGIVCEAQNLLAKKTLSLKKKNIPPQVLQEKVLGKFPLTPRTQELNHERTSTVRKINTQFRRTRP